MPPSSAKSRSNQSVVDYYTQAGPDYALWSPNFNMHFGYWRAGMDPGDREAMLEQMNTEVFAQCSLDRAEKACLLDLGCGLGAATRAAATHFVNSSIVGVSLVPWQVKRAWAMTSSEQRRRVDFIVADYLRSPFRCATFDFAYAIESSCYAPGTDKAPLISEARRVLRPGGRLVIADAMLRSTTISNPITRLAARALRHGWRLPAFGVLGHVVAQLRELGFVDVEVRDISWNVAPSVLHAPWVTFRFLVAQLKSGSPTLQRHRWENALACIPLLAFGVDRSASGYFIVSATRA